MIRKALLLIAVVMFQQMAIAQEKKTCDTPADEPALDLNSITKCSIQENKGEGLADRKSKVVSIEVSTRRRVVRKRDAVTGVTANKNSMKIANIKKKASLVGSLDLNNEEVVEKVPFNLVEEIPLFESCKNVAIYEQEKCFKEQIADHIKKNFQYPDKAYSNSIQGRVLVQFVIDKDGSVNDLNVRGPYKGELLEEEAKRIINTLPKFIPGKHNGKAVKVKYGVPIGFVIPGKAKSNIRVRANKSSTLTNVVKFAVAEQIPLFKACAKSNDTSEDCFNTELSKHVNKYFAYPQEAVDKNIEGRVYAYFIIDKEGHIADIKTRGPKDGKVLEEATKKLVEKLPEFSPGKHKGENANVKYAFPINFKLH